MIDMGVIVCFPGSLSNIVVEELWWLFCLFPRFPSQILWFKKYGNFFVRFLGFRFFVCFQGFPLKYCGLRSMVIFLSVSKVSLSNIVVWELWWLFCPFPRFPSQILWFKNYGDFFVRFQGFPLKYCGLRIMVTFLSVSKVSLSNIVVWELWWLFCQFPRFPSQTVWIEKYDDFSSVSVSRFLSQMFWFEKYGEISSISTGSLSDIEVWEVCW